MFCEILEFFCENQTIIEFDLSAGEESSEVFKEMLKQEEEKNWDGETHAIVFEYDFINNGYKYVFIVL